MAFQGSLAELHLPDIIQLISVSGKTGVFHLTDGAHSGQIYLLDGKIIHAQLEDIAGEEAVYALAIWNQGEFRFDPGVSTEQRTITKSNTNLLMEAARRLDEWRVLSKKIPSPDLCPEFVVQDNRDGQINLNTMEWLILSKIDGRRSIKAIAAAAGLSVFDICKILYGLITTNLLRLREPGAAPSTATAMRKTPVPGSMPLPPATQASGSTAELINRLNRVREVCLAFLGNVGESVVNKHYQKARAEIEAGHGADVIEEAIQQIARAASILKGPSATEALLEHVKTLRP
ncbi:MAG: DUF4388 domain-containing protein [Vicinamibacteria bacterium]|nr:DUF4388 domain-containing protein [Vicinamibacteria bacterium]